MTFYSQTSGLFLKYPDYWEIYTIGNDTLAIIPPLNFSGMLIKILDQNLDKFIYERIIFQKKTLEDFHLIHTYDFSSLNDKESKKSVIMYLVNEGSFS